MFRSVFDISRKYSNAVRSQFCDVVNIVHHILSISGVYGEYPTFRDYKNIAAYLVTRGKNIARKLSRNWIR